MAQPEFKEQPLNDDGSETKVVVSNETIATLEKEINDASVELQVKFAQKEGEMGEDFQTYDDFGNVIDTEGTTDPRITEEPTLDESGNLVDEDPGETIEDLDDTEIISAEEKRADENQVARDIERQEGILGKPQSKIKKESEAKAAEYAKVMDDLSKGTDAGRVLSKISGNGLAMIGTALAMIGSGLGAALQGKSGVPFLDMLNGVIDRDIESQRYNRELQLKRAGIIKKDLNELKEQEQTERTKEGLAYLQYYTATKNYIENKIRATVDPLTKKRLEDELDKVNNKLKKVYNGFTLEVTKTAILMDQKRQSNMAAQAKKFQAEKEDRDLRTITYKGGNFEITKGTSKVTIDKLKAEGASLNSSQQTISRLIAFNKQAAADPSLTTGIGKKSLQFIAQVETATELFKAQSRVELLGPGTVQQKEYERLGKIIPTGSDFFSWASKNQTKLQTLATGMDQAFKAKLSAFTNKKTQSWKAFDKTPQKKGLANTKSVGVTRIQKDSKNETLSVNEKGDRKTSKSGEMYFDGKKWVPYNPKIHGKKATKGFKGGQGLI